jgi:hypothetical protein
MFFFEKNAMADMLVPSVLVRTQKASKNMCVGKLLKKCRSIGQRPTRSFFI